MEEKTGQPIAEAFTDFLVSMDREAAAPRTPSALCA